MVPKILFTDIDGTLLNKDRELSVNTIEQVNRIASIHSIPVILVSARMPKSMRLLQLQLGLSNEIVCYNGALLIGSEDSIVLQDKRIAADISLNIIEMSKSYDLHFSVFVNNHWMISRKDEWSEREIRNTKAIPDFFNENSFDEYFRNGSHKIMLMGKATDIDSISLIISKEFLGQVNVYRSKDTYLEISPIETNKWNAIEKLLSIYNISFDRVIAIGDNYNDIEMIKYAGIGVAVDNAHDRVKKFANFICPSNINDGVAFTIEKFFR